MRRSRCSHAHAQRRAHRSSAAERIGRQQTRPPLLAAVGRPLTRAAAAHRPPLTPSPVAAPTQARKHASTQARAPSLTFCKPRRPPELGDEATKREDATRYWQAVAADVRARAWGALYARDQLHQQVASGRALYGFDDGGALPFAPTFKLATDEAKGRRLVDGDENAPLYDARRIPSYTDRVLSLSAPGKPPLRRVAHGVAGDGADGGEVWSESDHLPVWAVFAGSYMLQVVDPPPSFPPPSPPPPPPPSTLPPSHLRPPIF